MSERQVLLRKWLRQVLGGEQPELSAASSDASFRRYWRLAHHGQSLIAVDAPPETENNAAFVRMARALGEIGLNVPLILAEDQARGFLLVSDLGERPYLERLKRANVERSDVERLYSDAMAALLVLQTAGPRHDLPEYDAAFLDRELRLFDQWLLEGLLGLHCTDAERTMLEETYQCLIASALEQPRVCVHRDFHSRNLMLCDRSNPGILDFQDAVLGPISYDLVSLLKDCYVDWPAAWVADWVDDYLDLAVQSAILRTEHRSHFVRWFDLMGIQRHLKAAGIFARLALRDAKLDYLGDLPRTLGYVIEAGHRHAPLGRLAEFVEERVMPGLPASGSQ